MLLTVIISFEIGWKAGRGETTPTEGTLYLEKERKESMPDSYRELF